MLRVHGICRIVVSVRLCKGFRFCSLTGSLMNMKSVKRISVRQIADIGCHDRSIVNSEKYTIPRIFGNSGLPLISAAASGMVCISENILPPPGLPYAVFEKIVIPDALSMLLSESLDLQEDQAPLSPYILPHTAFPSARCSFRTVRLHSSDAAVYPYTS
mgnify:CR=1 FL=1